MNSPVAWQQDKTLPKDWRKDTEREEIRNKNKIEKRLSHTVYRPVANIERKLLAIQVSADLLSN